MQLPEAIHLRIRLRCFRHFRAILTTKLIKLHTPPPVINQFLNDVFGQTMDGAHECGLVDAMLCEEFDQKLQAYCKV